MTGREQSPVLARIDLKGLSLSCIRMQKQSPCEPFVTSLSLTIIAR